MFYPDSLCRKDSLNNKYIYIYSATVKVYVGAKTTTCYFSHRYQRINQSP